MANSFSPPRRNAMAPVQPVANVPMAVAPLYSAPTPQDAEVLKRFLLGAAKTTLAGVQFPGDLMHDAARSLRAGRPAGVYADLVETARRVSRDPAAVPGMVVNALKSQAEQARSSPGAMAETMGGMLDVRNMLRRKPTMAELVVYHGTPHTFEPEEGAPLGRFRSEKIGTGEGVQAFGHGLYLAETPSVGGEYRGNLSYREMVKKFRKEMPDNADVDEALEWANSGTAPPDMARVIKALNDDDWLGFDYPSQALNALFREPDAFRLSDELKAAADKMRGNLYKVDLPDAKIEQMLDWDKPLSEQPKAFQDAVAKLPRFQDPYVVSRPTGGQAYRELAGSLGSAAKASDLLRQQGIPGIKYFDAGSRTSKQGTRNFVVFPGEEQNLTILSRD